jgi:hypothetical protein
MDTYEVTTERYQPKLKHKLFGVFLFAAVFFALRFGWVVLWPSQFERNRGSSSLAIEIGFVSLAWALGMVYLSPVWTRLNRDLRLNFKLLVDVDSITAVYPIWRNRRSRKIVRKGKIRSIFEIKATSFRPGGIGISERKQLAARMLGFVYVPETLPEFDKVKSLAESWRISE